MKAKISGRGEEFFNKAKNFFMKREILYSVVVFLLAGVRLYGDSAPFSLAFLSCLKGNIFYTMLAPSVIGILRADLGFMGMLRLVLAHLFLFLSVRFLPKTKYYSIYFPLISILISGVSVYFAFGFPPSKFLFFTLIEAIGAAFFVPVLSLSLKWLSGNGGKMKESEKASCLILLILLCQSLEGEVGPFSITFALTLALSMGCAYKYAPFTAAASSMAAGFFTALFTVGDFSAVAFFTLASFSGAVSKRRGKGGVCAVFAILYLAFFISGVNISVFNFWDLSLGMVLFFLIPLKVYSSADSFLGEKDLWVRMSDKLLTVSDTFSSIADIFAFYDHDDESDTYKEAIAMTEKEVCGTCEYRKSCSIKSLSGIDEEKISGICRKVDKLSMAFEKNHQLLRLDRLWVNRMKEEREALSGQFKGISGVFMRMSDETKVPLERDLCLERELSAALRKEKISVKKISAGKNKDGSLEVVLEMVPCKNLGRCDHAVPKIIGEVTGVAVERYGIKNCDRCKTSYCRATPFAVHPAVCSIPKEHVSGDSVSFARIDNARFAALLSDGMGTGAAALDASNAAVKLAVRLLSVGMEIEPTLRMINSLLLRRSGGKGFVTMDLLVIDLEKGEAVYSKNGGVPGYKISCGGKISTLMSEGSPLGALTKAETEIKRVKIKEGDTILMMSDGVADAFGTSGDSGLKDAIDSFSSGGAEDLAAYISGCARKKWGKNQKDDMTVVALGCIKRAKSGNNYLKEKDEPKKAPSA